MQFTPDQLKSLQNGQGFMLNGMYYAPTGSYGGDENGGGSTTLQDVQGIYAAPQSNRPGDQWFNYDLNGNQTSTGQLQAPESMGSMLAKGGLAAAAMYFGLPALQGMGAGSTALPGLADAGSLGTGGTFASTAPAAGAANLADMYGLEQGMGAGLSASTPGVLESAAAAGGGAGNMLSSLMSGKGLGLLATGLGALAGSAGNNKNSTDTKSVPSWLLPYITGQNGLLQQTQTALNRSQDMSGWDNLKNIGGGLLAMPVAGNGYAAKGGK